MVMLKYAILARSGDVNSWLGMKNEHNTFYFFDEDFKNAYLFDYLKTASFLCDFLNEQTDGFVYKVCSVNIIIDED